MQTISDSRWEELRQGEPGRGALLARLALALVWPSGLAFILPFLAPICFALAVWLNSAVGADLLKCYSGRISIAEEAATERAFHHSAMAAWLSLIAILLWLAVGFGVLTWRVFFFAFHDY
jgi:hypothetical protein